MEKLFIDVKSLPNDINGFIQLCFLGMVYGYGLCYGSNMIADGSELLLLVPSVAGLVGSVVLPVLGAVPDGMIVLFAGLGEDAQNQLGVGIGALAGSSVSLLTLPWFLSILGGRVNIKNGKPCYKGKAESEENSLSFAQLGSSGVAISPIITKGSHIMMLTSISYLIIQLPGMLYLNQSTEMQAAGEKPWSLFGFFLCLFFFIGYLFYQYKQSSKPDTAMAAKREEFLRLAIQSGKVSLLGLMKAEFEHALDGIESKRGVNANSSNDNHSTHTNEKMPLASAQVSANAESFDRLDRLLRPFFRAYDSDKNGTLDMDELGSVFRDLGENVSQKNLAILFKNMDKDKSGKIEYREFVSGVADYCLKHAEILRSNKSSSSSKMGDGEKGLSNVDQEGSEEEEDDEEEMPPDLVDLPPNEQQVKIKQRALFLAGMGTLIVLILSDPMVDVLSDLGRRTGTPAFYVAFVLAPLVSDTHL